MITLIITYIQAWGDLLWPRTTSYGFDLRPVQ
jgi:hypothetical protein